MVESRGAAYGRLTGAALIVSAVLTGVIERPAEAVVTAVRGEACAYSVNVGLFGGPPTLRGCGQTASNAASLSPFVTLPAGGSATPITAEDLDGARATYGPAAIFAGKWPETAAQAPPSGPLTASTEGTPAGGIVRSSTSARLRTPPNPDSPGGIGPGPLIADEAHSSCTATEDGVTGSARFVNGIVETRYDPNTQLPIPSAVVNIPANPPPNTEVSGTLDHIGDHFRIVLNEQVRGPDSIVVTAAHMYLLGDVAVGEMIVGRSECAVTSDIPNAPPTANADSYFVTPGTTLTVPVGSSVLANDTDPQGGPLTARTLPPTPPPAYPTGGTNCDAVFDPDTGAPIPGAGDCITWVWPSDPEHGTLKLNSNGTFTYTPDAGYQGIDTFTYQASDVRGATSGTATVTIDVTNTPPTTTTTTSTTTTVPPTSTSTTSPPGSTTSTVPNSTTSTSTPPSTSTTVGNTTTTSTTSTIVNAAPVAFDDHYPDYSGGDPLVVAAASGVLENDEDDDGDTLTAEKVTDPAHGTLTLQSDGGFTYTPGSGFQGSDTFVYRAKDAKGATSTPPAKVTIGDDLSNTVFVEVNPSPESRPSPGGAFSFNILVTNPSDEALTILKLTDNVYGDVTSRGDCKTGDAVVLNPSPSPANTYSCSYTGEFKGDDGDSQISQLTVEAAPIAQTDAVRTAIDSATVRIEGGPTSGSDDDDDGDGSGSRAGSGSGSGSNTRAQSQSQRLSKTGSPIDNWVRAGTLLVCLGWALVTSGRTRRRPTGSV